MLFNNGNFGDRTKVFLKSLFHVVFDDSSSSPPLFDIFRITDDGILRITDDGSSRITDESAPF
jgi:hypothetical protein